MDDPKETRAQVAASSALKVALASSEDIDAILQIHPTPIGEVESKALRNYYRDKIEMFVTHETADIVVAWMPESEVPAGFVMFTYDEAAFVGGMRTPKAMLRAGWRTLTGRYGFGLSRFREIAGWVLQRLRPPSEPEAVPEGLPNSWVGTVQTNPDFKRRGVATRLMLEAERVLSARGVERVALYVAEGNTAARRLYEKLDYYEHARVQRIGEVCLIMTRDLVPAEAASP